MGSKTDTSIMTTDTEQKPQKITAPEFDPTKNSSSSSDPKTVTSLSSNSNCKFGNYPSFSQLLEGVMAANSTVSSNPLVKNLGFQGQFVMSHREALESVTAKAAQAQMQLQAESAKSSTDPPLMTQSELSVPSSSAVVKEEKSYLPHNGPAEERSEKNSTSNTFEPAGSSGQKTPRKLPESVNPCSVASLSTPKEEVDKQDTKQGKPSCNTEEHADDTPRTPKPDGYSWRKYGQKQVKSSGSSRSYYRCTTLNCCAKKKVQHLDVSGRIIGVVYKGDHNHDPPQNLRGSSRKKDPLSAVPVPLVPNDHNHDTPQNLKASSRKKDPLSAVPVPLMPNDHSHNPPQNLKGSSRKKEVRSASPVPLVTNDSSGMSLQKLDDSQTSTHRREHEQAVVPVTHEVRENNQNTSTVTCQRDAREQHTPKPEPTLRLKNEAAAVTAEAERSRSSNSSDLPMTDPMKDRDLAPLKKRRIKEGGKPNSDTVYRTFKDPKIAVHAAADAGTSNDGYRWRKYGQKMVKGNPHPRSYYRCSSAGCPVRKHVEKATDNSTAIIVTYEGKHDHEMPVPKKRHGSPNSSVCVAVSGTATTAPIENKETRSTSPSQGPPAKRSRDTEGNRDGEVVSEAGADKVLESARTLLSIGIELKSC